MCTFENDHRVLVCDIAIHQVREAASRAFGDAVHLRENRLLDKAMQERMFTLAF